MRRQQFIPALLAALIGAAPMAASGGAWTQPVGRAFVSGSVGAYRTRDRAYTQAETSVYAELGVLDWLTVGGTLEQKSPLENAFDLPGALEGGVFARIRLDTFSDGDPFSVQLGWRAQLGRFDPVRETAELFSGLDWRLDRRAIDLRLLYGRGFETKLGGGWMDVQLGPRFNGGPDADEFRLDATFGLRPADRWLVMAQAFTTLTLDNADYFLDNRSNLKLAASVGYEVTEATTLVLTAEREVWSVRSNPGTRVTLGVWRSFDLF